MGVDNNQKIAIYKDWGLKLLVWGTVLFITSIFLWIAIDVASNGIGQISWEFLTTEPRNAGRSGGILSVLISTGLILLVCLGSAVPLGLGTAILLAEYTPIQNWFARWVRRSLDLLAGVPSIVFGLFGNAFFCIYLGLGFSILSGGLTLACMILPILIRTIEMGLRSVPQDYRLAAVSLGLSRTSTLVHVLLPSAIPSLLAGLILGMGRAIAEAAALIYTSGYVDRTPESLFDSGRSLSIHIYDLSMNVPGGDKNAYASVLVLLVLLLSINSITTGFSRLWISK
ncbi:MAG: phosphate ABC transporter permease PstA [Cyanobacteria bacterium SBLK]|nr:phosphate ABC transporter permease PstA [Cyanobacteria bacterium SBLK]